MRFLALLTLLISLVSCTAHKLEVRLNGQPTQSMEARVGIINGQRTIDLILPGGSWAVSAEESGVVPRIVDLDGRKHVFVELPIDRMVSSKPIVLTLQGLDRDGKPSGSPYIVSLDYYNRQQKASRYT
ncbi:MAG: hypothetical protein WAS25_09625 [Geothrix sp.]|uniref:hypothetical protein n=1 Tax=Geothrix sp. TaxID=1962974 RepID=UPI003BB0747F